MKNKSRKLTLLLLSTFSVFGVSSCNGGGDDSKSSSVVTSSTTSSTTSSSVVTVEKQNTGKDGIDLSGISAEDKAEILGQVEAYGLKHHLLGIPLYGDGGATLINTRISLPITEYVANYGFGTLREGKITSGLSGETVEEYKEYLHEGLSSSNSKGLNPFDSNNNLSSSLLSYMTGELYGQRLVKDGNGGYKAEFEYYDSMADGDPVPVDWNEETKTANTWRIKVKTNENMVYHTLSTKSVDGTALSSFEGKKITAQDFVDGFRVLLNGNIGNNYASQYFDYFVGASTYYKAKTKVFTDADDEAWAKVGIKAIDDTTIELKYKTSMTKASVWTYSSVSPVNRDFFKLVTQWSGNSYDGKAYGKDSTKTGLTAADAILSSGPYTIKTYSSGTGSDNEIVYVRNDNYIDRVLENDSKYEVYAIKGMVYRINEAWGGDNGTTLMYQEYLANKLDTASIPQENLDEWRGSKPGKYITGNSSIAAIQVNGTDQTRWNELFGENGTVWENQSNYTYDEAAAKSWTVKPIMSNSDFLDGVYLSIDRATLADSILQNPSSNWLAEAYVMDMDTKLSYDSTEAHKKAISDWAPDTYGYNLDAAQTKFKSAMEQLTAAGSYTPGTKEKPTEIHLSLQLMKDTQKARWADKVIGYIQNAFNEANLNSGYKLVIDYASIPADPLDVYAVQARGLFDFMYGGITGGTADAFGMTGCALDSYDYGLALSFGVDTNIDDGSSIVYKGKSYSMKAIFHAIEAREPVVIKDGAFVDYASNYDDSDDSDEA